MNHILRDLEEALEKGLVTQAQVERVLASASRASKGGHTVRNFLMSNAFYILGGIVVLIGLSFFVALIWESLGSGGRIAITFGLGLLFAALGSFLMVQEPQKLLGQIFHLIGGVLVPGGVLVTLQEFSLVDNPLPAAIVFTALSVAYFLVASIHKKPLITFFAVANGTIAYFLYIAELFDRFKTADELVAVLGVSLMGVVYLYVSQALQGTWNKPLRTAFELFGINFFLGALVTQLAEHAAWLFILPLVILGCVYLSIFLRSRLLLGFSALYLTGYIFYLGSEFFSDSAVWPLWLILAGFVLMGIGYGTVEVSKRFIKSSAAS